MKTVYKWYCKIETWVVAAAFFTIIITTLGNVILRGLFNKPVIKADDICSLLFAWVSFMGADCAFRSNRLVGMDIVTMKLPVKVQKVLQIFVYLLIIAVMTMFFFKGKSLALTNWKRFFNTLSISYGWVTLSLPVCSVQIILTAVVKLIVTVKNFKNDDFNIKMYKPEEYVKEVKAS